MHVTRITFTRTDAACDDFEPATNVIQPVLGAWRMNGQICGREWPIVREPHGYAVVVLCPDRDSLAHNFNSSYVTTAVESAEADGLRIEWQVMGEDAESASACSCHSPSGYALFTTFRSLESPVRCMDCWAPVALYHFKPMASGEFYEVISWQSDYQSCDSLQMNCRVLERAATREISRIDSKLSADGRKHCATLAESSGRPFYYYLYRGQGRSARAELERRCPGCGGEWRLSERLHSMFDFKCDQCRLLSNVAFDFAPVG